MSTILHEPNAEEADQLQYVIAQYLDEMQRLNVLMAADQIESDRLKAETETIRARTRETAAETRATLADIKIILTKLEA